MSNIKGVIVMIKSNISVAKEFNDERFTKIDIIKQRSSRTFLLNFLPGQIMKQHNHPDRELYLHVLEGTGTLHVDEEDIEIDLGDVIYCDPNEQIGFTNTSKDNVSIHASMTKISK